MKMCKKIALLAIIFIMSTVLNVYAADPETTSSAEVIITPSATTAKKGETVTVTIVAKYTDGIEGFDGVLSWDATKLEFTNAPEINESTGGLSDFFEGETGKFLLTKMASSTTKDELKVATLKFEVLDSAEVDEKLTVSISDIEVGGYNGEIEDKTITLTVVEETKPEGGEQKPEGGEQKPEGGEQKPEGGEQKPGDKNPEQPKDDTTAKKPINNAGLNTYVLIGIMAIVFISIALYAKCRKYRDVK